MNRPRVLTGDRPTGALHLGHYFGTLANRLRLQAEGHDLFVVIADYQAIADRDHAGPMSNVVLDLALDYLAIGLDAERMTVFAHSSVPSLNQLMLPFLSLVSVGELQRNPTVKQEIAFSGRSTVSGLMLTYPVHQAADILFCQAGQVPVGRDQLPHLELTRTIARRFNDRYEAVFTVPEPILSETPLLLGFDGRKMGKSLGNAISLRASREQVIALVRSARTDGERTITFEPERRPEVANLLRIAGLCNGRDPAVLAVEIGTDGAGALKDVVIDSIDCFLTPMRERRACFGHADAMALLARGSERANLIGDVTLAEVRSAMGMALR